MLRNRSTLKCGLGLGGAFLVVACSSGGIAESGTTDEELVRQCATGETVKGIDVSKWQGTIDWTKVPSSGSVFAFSRVSDGVSSNDSKFSRNWEGSKAAGLVRGAYQYFRASKDATEQANKMVSAVGVLGDGDLPAVLDIEEADGQSPSTVLAKIRTWLQVVEAGTQKTPIIYTASYFWETLNAETEFAKYPLWVANYGATCPKMPPGFSGWSFWQYSASGSISGIGGNVDLNVFNGSRASLEALAGAPKAVGEAAVVSTALLNLRDGVGTSHAVVTQMQCGSDIAILEHDSSGWAKVRYGTTEGWCNEQYLKLKEAFDPRVCE